MDDSDSAPPPAPIEASTPVTEHIGKDDDPVATLAAVTETAAEVKVNDDATTVSTSSEVVAATATTTTTDSSSSAFVDVDVTPAPPVAASASAVSSPAKTATPSKVASSRRLRKDEVKEGVSADAVKSAESLQHDVATAIGGYLQKRSDNGLFKSWKKRWVMLTGGYLYYFEVEDSANPQGEFEYTTM